MQKYYHLSSDQYLTEIIIDNNDFNKGQIAPKVPEYCYGEDQTPRVCCSPTVWQCILSIPDEKLKNIEHLYIYETEVEKISEPKGGVGDSGWTDEKWIIDEDIKYAGNSIKLNLISKLSFNEKTKTHLKILLKQGKLSDIKNEKYEVWNVDGEYWELKLKI